MRALLLSGGMDSICLLWRDRPDFAITVDYGQRAAKAEIAASEAVCKETETPHHVVTADCSRIGSGDMSTREASVHAPAKDWWPYRNQLLASVSGPLALSLGATSIMFGSVANDANHADGRREFFENLDRLMANQEGALKISAPALDLRTEELVAKSGVPRAILAWAHSCHVGNLACGHCRGCIKHYEVTRDVFGDPY